MNDPFELRDIDYISAYALYITWFYVAVGAYKQTKQKGFVYFGFAALVFLLTAPLPFRPSHGGHPARFTDVTHWVSIGKNVLALIGMVLISRGYANVVNERKIGQAERAAEVPPFPPIE